MGKFVKVSEVGDGYGCCGVLAPVSLSSLDGDASVDAGFLIWLKLPK